MHGYNPQEIEEKWQANWQESGIYHAQNTSGKPKYYMLIEFPYPSGERLHVGHARSYCAFDAVSRYKRMTGYNVLYPIGWDAFGLPAENYAIKTGIHPRITVKKNIENAKKQAISWGLSFDWEREINTTEPSYYKWTQWIFLQLYKKGLAYRAEIAVNWCPSCKINLANEEVIAGNCERCGSSTQRRFQKQWLLKITAYAERLLNDLETVNYRNDIKTQQINWIGKKEGLVISYPVDDTEYSIDCFTTKPETNFGASFIVLAPENPLVDKIVVDTHKARVHKYVQESMKKSELERQLETTNKTGAFTGAYATNRLNGKKLPIYVGDFVLPEFGTGALVGVPAHDIRDYEFANVFDLDLIYVVDTEETDSGKCAHEYEMSCKSINSEMLNGLDVVSARNKISDYLVQKGWAKKSVTYHLRDWVFSRQHYWGEPIPIIHCPTCGEVPLEESSLPLELPFVEKYLPTDTGESPLAAIDSWVNVTCPKCGTPAKRETDTMPNWAGSSWYFLRYLDPANNTELASRDILKHWLPIDWYNGGLEHTTLHLLYSRFWYKFLFDIGVVPTAEPYAKRTSHGVVLGPDGLRMSKSRGNVINPDDIIHAYGADTLRLYIMFIGPFEQNVAWSNEAVLGVRRFLTKYWSLVQSTLAAGNRESSPEALEIVSTLIRKVESDLVNMKFNTSVAFMMETLNRLSAIKDQVGRDVVKLLTLAMAPCAPHITEEVWNLLGEKGSIHTSNWPDVSHIKVLSSVATIVVQVNGKVRGTYQASAELVSNEDLLIKEILIALNMREKHGIDNNTPRKYLSGKLVNFIK